MGLGLGLVCGPICVAAYCSSNNATLYSLSHRHLSMDAATLVSDPKMLIKLVNYRMPFGKYANELLIDLPEPYVVWFSKKGFPNGELGRMMKVVYEVKVNGLEYLFDPLRPK